MPTRPTDDDISIEFILGTDGNDVDADDIPIDDAGAYYTSTDVEGALQEIGAAGASALTVVEEDGTPSVTPVTTIMDSNGSLTDHGSGVVSVDTTGGGGGSTAFRGVVLDFAHSRSVPDGTVDPVSWDNEIRDTDNLCDLGSDDTIIATIAIDVAIRIHAQVTWSGTAHPGSRYLYVIRNDGSDHYEVQVQQDGTTNDETQDVELGYLECAAGDTISIVAYQDSGFSISYSNGYRGQVVLTILEEL